MARPKTQNLICLVENCEKLAKSKGYCPSHYANFRRNGTPLRTNGGKRNHPLYIIWWQRKKDKTLCEAWLDFKMFIKDVGEKPGPDFYLIRLKEGLFGPDNFKWEEHLRKRDDESFNQWWSRKRAKRIELNPNLETDRNLKRKYGLTREAYNKKLEAQNFVCKICGEKETAVDGRTNKSKLLAVDHNHKTGKIRDLLCWRCNTVIGKLNENLELLDKMKTYLMKHL